MNCTFYTRVDAFDLAVHKAAEGIEVAYEKTDCPPTEKELDQIATDYDVTVDDIWTREKKAWPAWFGFVVDGHTPPPRDVPAKLQGRGIPWYRDTRIRK